jgi:hypothetical protein
MTGHQPPDCVDLEAEHVDQPAQTVHPPPVRYFGDRLLEMGTGRDVIVIAGEGAIEQIE